MKRKLHFVQVPLIDIGPLRKGDGREVAEPIGQACRDYGFFYIKNHGVDPNLEQALLLLSQEFFKKRTEEKMEIAMARGGRAWRGYFPVGDELTSGRPDVKEGIYFGEELPPSHPEVLAQTPLHGANLFPSPVPDWRAVVLEYFSQMTRLGHALMSGLSLSLGLEPPFFFREYTANPLLLFRIFNYPAAAAAEDWGVGEHTDYGVLTILKQDDAGGLEVKTRQGWISAPPIPGTFICNIGDMLDRMTGGLYRSTPHRVKNISGRDRLSFPFFFDPGFRVQMKPLPTAGSEELDKKERWDGADLHRYQGTYGEYVMGKVGKVFPDLFAEIIGQSNRKKT